MHQSEKEIQEEHGIIRKAIDNPEVFGFLYEKYYKQIFLFVLRRIDDKATTADLVSQIFLKAMLNLAKYKFQGLPFSAWLYRIATNQVNEFYRGSQFQRVVSVEDAQMKQVLGTAHLSDSEKTDLITKLLEELDEDEVQILELRFFEDRPFKEVAFILEITENNAKVRTYRILEKLKKIATKYIASSTWFVGIAQYFGEVIS
ncbi:MAG: sigma-70 family RNA polymerase sigma factor [Cytophagales bacterium]|nr:MAG: sigma-70 family RNA polymerase sigma factor [Cytophagales bacterium]